MSLYFEGFQLDTRLYELRYAHERVPMEPQVFEVLALLVENCGRVVTKDELMEKIWGDKFISEAALNSRIMSARKAIGDSGREQRLIRTIHGRGYSFVGQVDGSSHSVISDVSRRVLPPKPAVARDNELRILQGHFDDTLNGQRRVLFLRGEAGIGKTTLVESFLSQIAGSAALVGLGQCVEQRGSGEAYLPVLEALRGLVGASSNELVTDQLTRRAASWVLNLPGLVDDSVVEELQRRANGSNRDVMLREFLDAVAAIAQEVPVVLVLEDLHWSDPSTLELIRALALQREPARLMVLATYRAGEPSPGGRVLQSMVRDLSMRRSGTAMTLGGFSAEDIKALISSRFGLNSPDTLAELLHHQTSGIPLFVEKLIESWLDEGVLVASEDGIRVTAALGAAAAVVPETVSQFIDQLFERLLPDEQQVLEVASVAGREFLAAEIAPACRRSDVEVEEICVNLARRGSFIEARGEELWPDLTTTSRFAFTHDIHREVLYTRMGAARRVMSHLEIGTRLEQAHPDSPNRIAPSLAFHFTASSDITRAVKYSRIAADQQLQRSAHAEAIEHLRRARELLDRRPPSRQRAEEELSLLIALGNALITAKGYAATETKETYADARQICNELGDGPHFLPVLYGLWNNSLCGGAIDSGYELACSFLELAEKYDHSSLAVAHRAMAWPLVFMGKLDEARQHLDATARTFDPAQTATLMASYGEDPLIAAAAAKSWVCWLQGDTSGAEACFESALSRSEELAHPFSSVYVLVLAATLAHFRRDAIGARHHAEAGLALARQHAIPFFEALALVPLAWATAIDGDVQSAMRILFEGSLARTQEIPITYVRATEAEVLSAAGLHAEALKRLDEALELAKSNDELFYLAEVHRLRGNLLITMDNHGDAEAEACFRRAIVAAHEIGATAFEARAAADLNRLTAHSGRQG